MKKIAHRLHNPAHKKRWIVATGFSRGIGQALARELSPHFSIFALGRSPSPECTAHLTWDLAKDLTDNPWETLRSALEDMDSVAGFLHCGGVLGPVGAPAGNASPQERNAYWREFHEAMQINFRSGAQLTDFLLPYLLNSKASLDAGQSELELAAGLPTSSTSFVMHLSSGAAINPYVGWEAYCVSKASLLMYSRCLAARYSASTLLSLVVAPGRVATDMMKQVLASNESAFPALRGFQESAARGELQEPHVPAQKIRALLCESPLSELGALHGQLYDLRKGIVPL